MTPDRRESVYLAQTGRPTFTKRQERRYAKRISVPRRRSSGRELRGDGPLVAPD